MCGGEGGFGGDDDELDEDEDDDAAAAADALDTSSNGAGRSGSGRPLSSSALTIKTWPT